VCRICKEPGHVVTECETNRLFALNGVVGDVPADEAWEALKAADKEKDTLEIKQVRHPLPILLPLTDSY
jgi:hypothetical protein